MQLNYDVVWNMVRVKLSKDLKTNQNTKKLKEKMQAASVDWANNRFIMLKECA